MSPNIMFHALRAFSLMRLEQHFVWRTGIHELDIFCARDRLTCHVMGHPLHNGQCLLAQHVMCVSCLQQVWLTLHLHATHFILVIWVDEFNIFINLSK